MSQGPSSKFGSVKEATCEPKLSRTSSEPWSTPTWPGSMHMPVGDGRLPTSTNPCRNTARAVVSPSPGGGSIGPWKKSDCSPPGVILTIVLPVPCVLPLLLKLETRMSPGESGPPFGNPGGTKATPYGFISEIAGTVEILNPGTAGRFGISGWCLMSTAEAELHNSRNEAPAAVHEKTNRFIIFSSFRWDAKLLIQLVKRLSKICSAAENSHR